MERYGSAVRTTNIPDPAHYGKYQVELEAEIVGPIEPVEAALESAGYVMVDFDPWGMTYLSKNDPDLRVDVDELDDYGDNIRLFLRKSRLSEQDAHEAEEYLQRIYCELTNETAFAHIPLV